MLSLFKSLDRRLDEAKEKLESELENGDMDFLIEKMNSDAPYSELLKKRNPTETRNTDNVSWYAFRQAEKVESDEHKARLLGLLEESSDAARKRCIYFALSHCCKNRTDFDLFNVLMDKLKTEKNKDCRSSLMRGISSMDKYDTSLNLEPLKELAIHGSRFIKMDAIGALQKSNSDEIEPFLLEIFEKTDDSYIKESICQTLESVGTDVSIEPLEKEQKGTRNKDLKYSIEEALKAIHETQ